MRQLPQPGQGQLIRLSGLAPAGPVAENSWPRLKGNASWMMGCGPFDHLAKAFPLLGSASIQRAPDAGISLGSNLDGLRPYEGRWGRCPLLDWLRFDVVVGCNRWSCCQNAAIARSPVGVTSITVHVGLVCRSRSARTRRDIRHRGSPTGHLILGRGDDWLRFAQGRAEPMLHFILAQAGLEAGRTLAARSAAHPARHSPRNGWSAGSLAASS